MTTFEKIKKLAKDHGMTIAEVNEKAGLGKNSLYNWKYQKPSYENLKKVADVLGTTPDKLNGLSSDKDSGKIQWKDLDMPYGGSVPDELKDYYKAMAEQYIKQHPEILKKRDEK